MHVEITQNSSSRWWIWPLLPFAAVGGGMLGASFFVLMQWFNFKMLGYREDGWLFLYVRPLMSAAAFGWLYAYITLRLAPKGKVIAASVMVTILGVILAIGVLLMWWNPQRETGVSILATAGTVATMFVAIATIVFQKDEFE